jgi:hypothetical protein
MSGKERVNNHDWLVKFSKASIQCPTWGGHSRVRALAELYVRHGRCPMSAFAPSEAVDSTCSKLEANVRRSGPDSLNAIRASRAKSTTQSWHTVRALYPAQSKAAPSRGVCTAPLTNKCAMNRRCKTILKFVWANVYFRGFQPFSPDRLTTSLPFSS